LLDAQLEMARHSSYTQANFAYGSTPLRSWLAVFQAVAMRLGAACSTVRYTVLGSSLGSLSIYGACVYGWRARGIELLPLLTRHATRVVRSCGVIGVHFECADMLDCDLSNEDVIMLASQCWDDALVAAVRMKMLNDLPEGSLVVDYTDALGKEVAEVANVASPPGEWSSQTAWASWSSCSHVDDQHAARHFALECTVRAPVSWDGGHQFWIWRVCGARSATSDQKSLSSSNDEAVTL